MPGHALLMGAIFLGLCFGAAALGAAFTARSVREWYPKLRKPAGTPPNSYFGPVWTALYILMAIAAWNVYLKGGGLHQAALPSVPRSVATTATARGSVCSRASAGEPSSRSYME